MPLLSKAFREKEFDVRMIQRGLVKGQYLQADIEKNTKKLADDGGNAEFVSIDALRESVGRRHIATHH